VYQYSEKTCLERHKIDGVGFKLQPAPSAEPRVLQKPVSVRTTA
jgi:hypothetical protein